MMCLANSVASGPGETPDLEASPEVLIWMWMLRGVDEGISARPALSWLAFLVESTEETRNRFGMVEARGLHLSGEG